MHLKRDKTGFDPWVNDRTIKESLHAGRCKPKKRTRTFQLTGIINKVGVGYVDLVRNRKLITVLTKRITNIEWVNPNCKQHCFDEVVHACDCNNHGYCPHCHQPNDNCNCSLDSDYPDIHDPVIPFCDGRIHLRLAGLTNHVNFDLFQHEGCKVVLELEE